MEHIWNIFEVGTGASNSQALLADYNAAQSGGHHVDCDGYMLTHRTTIHEHRYPGTATRTYSATCEECGALHVGSFGQRADCESLTRGHAQEVPCDGRCKNWN